MIELVLSIPQELKLIILGFLISYLYLVKKYN